MYVTPYQPSPNPARDVETGCEGGTVTFSSFGLTFLTELLAERYYGTISPGTVESECATSYRVPHCTGHEGKNSPALGAFGGFLMQQDITVQIAG